MAVAPDGSWLASAGPDRTARIWDAAVGRERAVEASSLPGETVINPIES